MNCKREVGTTFSENNRIFKAVCGDPINPCPLHIELVVGKKHHIDDIMAITDDLINDTKEQIIKLKMDLTYNYKEQEEIIEEFNILKQQYIELQKKIETLINVKAKKMDIVNRKNNVKTFESELYELTSTISNLIQEYEKESDPQKITTIVNIYNDNLREILVNIRSNKYFVNRVNIESKKEPGNIITYGTLIQNEIDNDNMFIYFDDDEKSERKVFKNK